MNEDKSAIGGGDNELSRLYIETVGFAPDSIMLLPGAGSSRKYYRLRGPESLIGVVGTDVAENRVLGVLTDSTGICTTFAPFPG